MKKLLIVALLATSTTAFANTDELKIKTVKQIYANAIKADNYRLDKYATPSFAKELKRVDKVSQRDIDYGTGIACYESYPQLLFSDWDWSKVKQNYSINKRGQVIAKMSYGKETETITFTLQCTQNKCLLADVLDDFGNNKAGIGKYCPK